MHLSPKLSTDFLPLPLKGGLILAALLLCLTALVPQRALAASPISESFSDYSTGELSGQDGWNATSFNGGGTVTGVWSVVGSGCYTDQCLYQVGSANAYMGKVNGTPLGAGELAWYVKVNSGVSGTKVSNMGLACNNGSSDYVCGLKMQPTYISGVLKVEMSNDLTGYYSAPNLTPDVWHKFEIVWDLNNGASQVEFLIDDVSVYDSGIFGGDQSTADVVGFYFYSPSADMANNVYVDDIGYTAPLPPQPTEITTVTPFATTTATTTTVGYTGYVSEDDFVEGMTVHVDFLNPTVQAVSTNVIDACNVFGAGKCSLDFPIDTWGAIASSTTITFNYGGTTKANWSIRKPNFWSSLWLIGGLFRPDTIAFLRTSFVVGYQTTFDAALNGDGTAVNGDSSGLVGYFTSGGTSSTTPVATGCANVFTGGTIVECLVSLVIPSGTDMANNFDQLYQGVLAKAPFGYATRFLTIISGNVEPVEPPPFTYTFGTASPEELQGATWEIQIFDYFNVVTEAVADDGSERNIWDLFMPLWNMILALVVLLAILSDLFGFEIRGGRRSGEDDGDDYGALTPREKALADRAQYQAKHGGGIVGRR